MAKREKRAQLFGKLGLLGSLLAAIGAVAGMVLVIPRWNFSESLIFMGPTRSTITTMALFMTFVLGIGGFLGGLEGVTSEDKKIKSFGWIAFWFGVVSTMVAIILGLCIKYYSV
jgi:hypothetical protein